jgi:MFS family permease
VLLGPLLVAGTGSGLFIAPNAQFIIATVDRQEAGAASGVIATMQRLGTAIGIAIIGSVFFGTLSIPTTGRPTAGDLATAFTHSAASALGVSAAFAVVAFALVFVLPKRVTPGPPAAPVTTERDASERASREL